MEDILKQLVIYLSCFLAYVTFSLIFPFYPGMANDKGVPTWLNGIIFSLNPMVSLLSAMLVGKYMNKIGRKEVLTASIVLISLSMFLLSPTEYVSRIPFLILSVASRIISGMGAGFLLTTSISILTSDYPDKSQIMLGRMEAFVGTGIMVGPLIGQSVKEFNLFIGLIAVGLIVLLFAGISWKLIGTLREYLIRDIKIDRIRLLLKPVIFTQKIFLTLGMAFFCVFSISFLSGILEIHLNDKGANDSIAALCFTILGGVYLVACLTIGYIFKNIDERYIMIVAMGILSISYLLVIPWSLVFPDYIGIIISSTPVFALGEALSYCKFYIVFTVPYMVKSAVRDYKYFEDDILTDAISSFTVFAFAIGEILGPIFSCGLYYFVGMEATCEIAAAINLLFGFIFAFGTGVFLFSDDVDDPKRTNLLSLKDS
jgi:MFS family permease